MKSDGRTDAHSKVYIDTPSQEKKGGGIYPLELFYQLLVER
jgi:hypothetical protein